MFFEGKDPKKRVPCGSRHRQYRLVVRQTVSSHSLVFFCAKTKNAIDLDLQVLEENMAQQVIISGASFHIPLRLYQQGGNVAPYALLQLQNNETLPRKVRKGTPVHGAHDKAGRPLHGARLWQDAALGEPVVAVEYEILANQSFFVECRVGALAGLHRAYITGCELCAYIYICVCVLWVSVYMLWVLPRWW